MSRPLYLATLFATVLALPSTLLAAEICGNGLDDDADNLQDEGCYPAITTGVCESPLSCGETGMISPSTGSLHYSLPPDVAPKVPWGPGIGFRRFYTSQYDPGAGAPVWKKPLGDRWQHTYMSWLTLTGAGAGSKISLHTSRGQDIQFTFSSGDGLVDFYTPQPGFHFSSMTVRRTCNIMGCSITSIRLATLTGETWIYNASGKLSSVQDAGLKSVSLSYDGNGQVSTVTDSQGSRRLLFNYTSNQLSSLQFQILISSVWTTQHTTSYGYTSGALTTVTIGGELAQNNTYTSGYLTRIADGASKPIVNFTYAAASDGAAVRADTVSGMIGVERNSSRASCSGKTAVYFNLGSAATCTNDAGCASGQMCGAIDASGFGRCFRGGRCLTLTSPSEDLVTTVAPLAPSGHTCDGACLDVAQYIWNTGGNAIDLKATRDPHPSGTGAYETRAFNVNGLPVKISYGDPDDSPDNTNGARTVYLFYDTTFPGKVSEIRRKSDLDPNSCTESVATGCARTLYFYNANGKPSMVREIGTTLNTAGLNAAYQHDTEYSYDSNNRLTQIALTHGTASDTTEFTYWSSSDPLKNGFLQDLKRKRNATDYLTSSSATYDFWGNPTTLAGSDTDAGHATGSLTCLTFSAARGQLTSRREAMAGQSDCTTPNAADITTSWARDSALRLTQLTRPDGSCMFYEHGHTDSTRPAHLLRTKRRDDCNAASAGDRQEFLYDAEGLVTEIQTYDAANVLTSKKPFSYFDSRRLEKTFNPVDTSKFTGFVYDDRGDISQVSSVDASGSLGKTVYNRAGVPGQDNRVTSVDRYKTASLFDTWNLLYDWTGNQSKVTDSDTKSIETVRDDLGRVVKLITPDKQYPTLTVYDNANRVVHINDNFGSTGGVHTFAYDGLGRLLAADYTDPVCAAAAPQPEIKQVFDTLAGSGVSCPAGMTCARTGGRLAYVKAKLLCSSTYSATDGTLDQETFFDYDDAGRVIREYIRDDAGRIADHLYTWTKTGELASVTTPSGAVLGSTFGSAGSNSDTDRITAIWRTNSSTPIADAITWFPYGPLKQYNQQHLISNKAQRTVISRNLAYRITNIAVENQSNGADTFAVAIAEDAKGRVTKRDYSQAAAGVQDSYFLYDNQDRLLCETTNVVSSCPTSGTNIKNSRTATAFTAAGDWRELLRPVPGSTGLMNSFNPSGYGASHQVTMVRQNDGTPQLGDTVFGYDAQGSRSFDDNTSTLTNDRRDYTYDGRGNVINVHGKYFSGGTWRDYDVGSAFDAKNRRIMKSFRDATTGVIAQWFFYYDLADRLIEVKHTPNVGSASMYTHFQLFWLRDRLVLFWQTDLPAAIVSRRYTATDEAERIVDMWSWPASGNAIRAWAISPAVWGPDTNLVGPTVFQPQLFAGQYCDPEVAALANDGLTVHRPGTAYNRFRTYDPLTGAYLQVDPRTPRTWSTYLYARSNPIAFRDPTGLEECEPPATPDGEWSCDGNEEINVSGAIDDVGPDSGIWNFFNTPWGQQTPQSPQPPTPPPPTPPKCGAWCSIKRWLSELLSGDSKAEPVLPPGGCVGGLRVDTDGKVIPLSNCVPFDPCEDCKQKCFEMKGTTTRVTLDTGRVVVFEHEPDKLGCLERCVNSPRCSI